MKDFVAIGFETTNKEPSSTVIVRDGEIMDSCCILIYPELDFMY